MLCSTISAQPDAGPRGRARRAGSLSSAGFSRALSPRKIGPNAKASKSTIRCCTCCARCRASDYRTSSASLRVRVMSEKAVPFFPRCLFTRFDPSPPSPPRCSRKTTLRRQRSVAQDRRSAAPEAAQARRHPGRGRGGRARRHDVPAQYRAKLHSTNPLERVNDEIKRRTEMVGIFPNEDVIARLVGAILLEQNDEWALTHSPGRDPFKCGGKIAALADNF